MKCLEEAHPELCHACFRSGGSAEKINPATLAKWLALRASQVGAEKTYSSLISLETSTEVTAYNITLINGLDFQGVIEFPNDFYLADYHNLPDKIKNNVHSKVMSGYPNIHPPYTFLFKSFRSDLISDDLDDSAMDSLQSYVKTESIIVNFLSLFSVREAPTIDKRWCLLEDDVPMSGIVDNSYTHYLEIKPPKGAEDWGNIDLNEVIDLYQRYMAIPEKKRLPVDISLWRRAQAMNTWDNINKAIDLGIALESVLTSAKTRDQLSLQIRVLGAKLSSSDRDGRSKVFSKLKCIYGIRSEAVHNGTVDKFYKIKDEGRKSTNEIRVSGLNG
ncbi:HEPN domain-containing protein [Halomonas sp. Mc5H-6]|uniref:HEPN domain-containing protein n=1 Tax=Halomonas sp. Mc5H-6 TaxID=2954500 RepID=UPI0020971425|nr:HEPN domain-containing protein [Halomonas sp. Mc5H-6]MCO7245837.1 HEPN domain-containing protein [Halomonas sp. Mc5H-6]